ncbi:MAG: cytochrome c3 family protein [Thermodesulfovibrionales bacterium]
MLNKATRYLLMALLLISAVSCNFAAQEADSGQPPVSESVVQKNPVNLPCFSCHSYDDFQNPEVFPHSMHKDMGLHCNQCHIIKSHESMSLNGSTCNNCHNLTIMKLSLTSMPVSFNHQSHAGMFGCGDCHKEIFNMKTNSVRMTMKSINKGKFCGKCHNGKIAFPSTNCNPCHSTG